MDWDAIERRMAEAVQHAVSDRLVGRWVMMAEVIDPETGEPELMAVPGPGMADWDVLGWLDYQRSVMHGRIARLDED